MTLPVTEISSQFTRELDRVEDGCSGMVRMLRQADGQLWAGYGPYAGIYDESTLSSMEQLSALFRQVVDSSKGTGGRTVAVMSGCGTSGRMAYYAARLFNQYIPGAEDAPPSARPFRYLVSGGDLALVVSQELPEDDPHAGVRDLEALVADLPAGSTVIVVGITCGISAPYVLGQMQHAMDQAADAPLRFLPVLIGFNPTDLARNSPVEGWTNTCRDVAKRLEQLAASDGSAAVLLNPVLGPEAVTASSRMKGGSAAKILLDVCFFHSFGGAGSSRNRLLALLAAYERVHRQVYFNVAALSNAMEWAGHSLSSGGHLYYLGASAAGQMGFIDASEMYDTYGEDFYTVQGFMQDGWVGAGTNEGQLAALDGRLALSFADFRATILPKLAAHDTVVVASLHGAETQGDTMATLVAEVDSSPCRLVRVTVRPEGSGEAEKVGESSDRCAQLDVVLRHTDVRHVVPEVPAAGALPLAELALKYVYNAISTAACVVKGLVYSNRMINMGISNNKLFYRAIRIIQDVTEAEEAVARQSLLCAIHSVEREEAERRMAADQQWQSVQFHVITATPLPQVLPHAILLASDTSLTYAAAHAALAAQPLLRSHIRR